MIRIKANPKQSAGRCEQVNKNTAPELLKSWRSNSKANPVDLYIKDKRVVHMRNWLCRVRSH